MTSGQVESRMLAQKEFETRAAASQRTDASLSSLAKSVSNASFLIRLAASSRTSGQSSNLAAIQNTLHNSRPFEKKLQASDAEKLNLQRRCTPELQAAFPSPVCFQNTQLFARRLFGGFAGKVRVRKIRTTADYPVVHQKASVACPQRFERNLR